MPSLAPGSLLELWERALALTPVERAVALAAAAAPAAEEADVARLPLGRRDARLLRLRADWAGPGLESTAGCPACGEQVELAPDADVILGAETSAKVPEPVESGGCVVTWRLPDSSDMLAAAAAADAVAAERTLLERCVSMSPSDEPLSPECRAAVAAAMAAADPVADVLVDLTCPACDESFTAELDVAGTVWSELNVRAGELLREVDVLARAYGWTEAEVLSLGQGRRDAYLAIVEGAPA